MKQEPYWMDATDDDISSEYIINGYSRETGDPGNWGDTGSGNAKAAKAALPMVWFGDVEPNLDTADFVEGTLTAGAMSVIYGESNCGKTFWTTDLGLHVAIGRTWNGLEVDQGGVIYCALEGSHGILNRIVAFKKHHGLDGADLPFAVIPSAINMLDPEADTPRLIAAIQEAAAKISMPVSLVVIDTLARALSGGDENGPKDMGVIVSNTDRVRQATGAHVAYVHHSGKDQAKGARGHSSLRAATDTEIEVSRPDKNSPSLAKVMKQRDLPIEGEFSFKLEVVELGTNRRGKPVTSCVVLPATAGPTPTTSLLKQLSGKEQIALTIFDKAMKAESTLATVGDDHADRPVLTDAVWRKWYYQEANPGETQENKRQAFKRARDGLMGKGRIVARDDFVWRPEVW